jgi:hypothetical protein
MKDQKKRAVKTRPFGREDGILSEKCAKCVIFKRNMRQRALPNSRDPASENWKAQCALC